jgi:serine/threonine protein phosphatase PrpC
VATAGKAVPGTLITPLEPGLPQAARSGGPPASPGLQSCHAAPLTRIDAAVVSSCGSQHEANEDAHSAVNGTGQLFVVADGVGGGAMAQWASRHLVVLLHRALDARPLDAAGVCQAVLDADRSIARRITQLTDVPGAATVALCAPVDALSSKWLVAWVGDCRVYRLALGGACGIELLTRDDTFGHLRELPPSGGSLDDPARMVGNGATSGANVAWHDLPCGAVMVLCSDGAHKYLSPDDWSSLLNQPIALAQRCADLITRARANGSADDATVLLLQRTDLAAPRRRWITRWLDAVTARRTRL